MLYLQNRKIHNIEDLFTFRSSTFQEIEQVHKQDKFHMETLHEKQVSRTRQ